MSFHVTCFQATHDDCIQYGRCLSFLGAVNTADLLEGDSVSSHIVQNPSESRQVLLKLCTGETSETGNTGNIGETGDTGDTSDTDEIGETGEIGDTGDTSDTGETGNTRLENQAGSVDL
ncbi:hypothetical protein C2G38_2212421 [Gigaspora rosea]|uniref:Collagen triple helix repeat protein n=1 Tax=Gigaspora rosea TaxID=44941 RepID=A0A397UGC5_9GLOM|nr:hypothetical protein C2G38_2212421 [Gigaspora rosea]